MNGHFQHGTLGLIHGHIDHSGLCFYAVIQHNALGHLHDLLFGGMGAHSNTIQLADLVAGMREHIGEIAVVGHQQQTLAVFIQTAHRENAGGHILNKIHHGFTAQLVTYGGDIAAGLMEHNVIFLLFFHNADLFTVHHEHIMVDIHFIAHLHGVAVQLYTALTDHLLGGTAGAKPLIGHYFLNAFFCHCILL